MYCTLPSTVCVIEMWSFTVFLVLMVALPIVVRLALVKGVASLCFGLVSFCIFRHGTQQFHPAPINSGWLITF